MTTLTPTPEPTKSDELARILRLFRAAVPCARGVVIATSDGWPVAHDLPAGADPLAAAGEAVADRNRAFASTSAEPASAFVETPTGLALVVFMSPAFTLEAGLAPDADRSTVEWPAMDLAASAGRVLAA